MPNHRSLIRRSLIGFIGLIVLISCKTIQQAQNQISLPTETVEPGSGQPNTPAPTEEDESAGGVEPVDAGHSHTRRRDQRALPAARSDRREHLRSRGFRAVCLFWQRAAPACRRPAGPIRDEAGWAERAASQALCAGSPSASRTCMLPLARGTCASWISPIR